MSFQVQATLAPFSPTQSTLPTAKLAVSLAGGVTLRFSAAVFCRATVLSILAAFSSFPVRTASRNSVTAAAGPSALTTGCESSPACDPALCVLADD
jgi:hypothetical protein